MQTGTINQDHILIIKQSIYLGLYFSCPLELLWYIIKGCYVLFRCCWWCSEENITQIIAWVVPCGCEWTGHFSSCLGTQICEKVNIHVFHTCSILTNNYILTVCQVDFHIQHLFLVIYLVISFFTSCSSDLHSFMLPQIVGSCMYWWMTYYILISVLVIITSFVVCNDSDVLYCEGSKFLRLFFFVWWKMVK